VEGQSELNDAITRRDAPAGSACRLSAHPYVIDKNKVETAIVFVTS